ncbi:MAG: protein kinase, partial [Planctomycetota bacterium]
MTWEREKRALDLFEQVCDLPREEQSSFVEQHCADDSVLRIMLVEMLEADAFPEDSGLEFGDSAEVIRSIASANSRAAMPEKLGRYQIIRPIGRGGMGVVYEAEQSDPKRRVAVKVVREGFGNRETIRRFRQEAELLGRLQHPGIAHVYEAGIDGHTPFYAMEFVDGLPIDQHAEERNLGLRERIELMARVCDAVQHAHHKGILHRDIKPANVLVVAPTDESALQNAGGESASSSHNHAARIDSIGQPKVLDFGIARLADHGAVTQHTHTGQILGSIASMSPEQLAGDPASIDTRADIYSLGVMLYRLLADRPPHDLTGLMIAEAARRVAEQDPPTLASVSQKLRGDLSVIAAKALARDINERYESAAVLAEDLRRTLRNEPIVARPPAASYRFKKFVKRHSFAVALGAVAIALLVSATALSTWLGVHAIAARSEADRATYLASISAAAAALREGDARLARDFLVQAPPQFRGWEWFHYNDALDASEHRGERAFTLSSEVADFQDGRCWLSPDGSMLHVGSHNERYGSHVFESFDAESLQSIGDWRATQDERCIGVIDERSVVVMYHAVSGELVLRDVVGGHQIERLSAGSGGRQGLASYSRLPTDLSLVSGWIDVATNSTNPLIRPDAVLSPDVSAWVECRNNPVVRLVASDAEPRYLGTVREGGSAAAFSPDAKLLAFASLDRQLSVFDLESGKSVWTLPEAHSDAPMVVTFNKAGTILATGGQDRIIKLRDAQSGELLGQLMGHIATINALAFSKDGQTIYSADASAVRRWKVRDAIEGNVLWRHRAFAARLRLSPKGERLASTSLPIGGNDTKEDSVLTMDLRAEAQASPIPLPATTAWAHDAKLLGSDMCLAVVGEREPNAIDGVRGSAYLSNLRTGVYRRLAVFQTPQNTNLLFRDGRVWINQGHDGRIDLTAAILEGGDVTPKMIAEAEQVQGDLLHQADKGDIIRLIGEHEWLAHRSAIHEPSGLAYVVGENDVIQELDLKTGRVIRSSLPAGSSVRSIALLPDGSRLFGASGDRLIRVWD